MTRSRRHLVGFIAKELDRPVPLGAIALADRLRELYGDAVRGVLFYGSCLRKGTDADGVLDLYVLVDSYRGLYKNPLLTLANALLPPNVFYLETRAGGRTVRAKYAVLSRRDLVRSTSSRAFQSYFWARFAQPCALVYAADPTIVAEVSEALAEAVVTFLGHGVRLVGERFRPAELWTTTLRETYRCEVRPERASAPEDLYGATRERYAELTRLALPCLPHAVVAGSEEADAHWTVRLPVWQRRMAPWLWHMRRLQGKTLFLLRMLRNGLIFEGGVDFVISKVRRHSGEVVTPGWRDRRFPLLVLGAEVWRLYRRGAFR